MRPFYEMEMLAHTGILTWAFRDKDYSKEIFMKLFDDCDFSEADNYQPRHMGSLDFHGGPEIGLNDRVFEITCFKRREAYDENMVMALEELYMKMFDKLSSHNKMQIKSRVRQINRKYA